MRYRNGGAIPAKLAPLTSFRLLVPPTFEALKIDRIILAMDGCGYNKCVFPIKPTLDPGGKNYSARRKSSSLQSCLPLPPPAMLIVNRLTCLFWSTALALLCVSCLVSFTSRCSKP